MNELKACPFCGSVADISTNKANVTCSNGGCKMFQWFSVEDWNTRAIDPRLKEVVKEILFTGRGLAQLNIIYKYFPESVEGK